ncbi:hypothetical protein ABT093_24170 [Kitasatospora sp. NPDC002551]|uniref:hypothetical protein n=1 Tax=Kitasatospora sp. NPDC002551 TaxID=3154539 RepID=UPI0033164D6D
MTPIMALSARIPKTTTDDLDELYGRYAGRLLVAAAEQLAEISPAAADLDEDLADAVWDDVAAGLYPDDARGLDGLLVLLAEKVRRVRTRATAASEAVRSVVIDLDDLAGTEPVPAGVVRPLPVTVSAAVATLRALPLAG